MNPKKSLAGQVGKSRVALEAVRVVAPESAVQVLEVSGSVPVAVVADSVVVVTGSELGQVVVVVVLVEDSALVAEAAVVGVVVAGSEPTTLPAGLFGYMPLEDARRAGSSPNKTSAAAGECEATKSTLGDGDSRSAAWSRLSSPHTHETSW